MKLIVPACLVILALSGCLHVGNPVDCADPEPVDRPARFDGQTLSILDQGAAPTLQTVRPAFENLTGARIKQIDGGDAGTALRTALLSAGNPPADILYGVDNALFFTEGVHENCLYVPYESALLSNVNETVINLNQFRINDQLWATPIDHAYVGVNYDIRLRENRTESELPTTLRDLASPRWAPQFATIDPRTSSPGLLFLLATIDTFGEDGDYTWKDYWRELLENGALVAKDWTDAYVYHFTGGYGQWNETTFVGGRSIVISYTTSPAVEVYFGTPEVPSVSLEPARGVAHQIETMGILRGSKNVALAQAFIDFALSHEFQNRTIPELATYPVVRDIPVPDVFTELATDPAKLQPAELTTQRVEQNLDRWIDEWVTLYQTERA